ncbi:MAG TPA: hypothetical protein VGH86_17770 [Phenylobacterium sp.]
MSATLLGLGEICKMEGMPSIGAFIRWRKAWPELEAAYLEACAASPGWRGPIWSGLAEETTAPRKAAKPTPGPRPRPSRYTSELGDRICERIMAGSAIGALGADLSLPSTVTLFNWLEKNEGFRGKYAAACEIRAEALADEAQAICADASGDLIPGPDGRLVPNHAAVSRARLMFEYCKWRTSKLSPKRYGLRAMIAAEAAEKPVRWEDILAELDVGD